MLPTVTAMFIQCRNVRSLAARECVGNYSVIQSTFMPSAACQSKRVSKMAQPFSGAASTQVAGHAPKKALASVRRRPAWDVMT